MTSRPCLVSLEGLSSLWYTIKPSTMAIAEQLLPLVTVTNTALALFAYIALRFIYQIVHYRFYHPLSAFPGPFWGTVTRLWIAWHNAQETELPTVYALAKKYGMSTQSENRKSLPTH
jgi:hypothetical protein